MENVEQIGRGAVPQLGTGPGTEAGAGPGSADRRWLMLAGGAGLGSAILTAAGIALIPRSPDTSARAIAAYFVQHHGALQISSFLRGGGMLLFLLFLAGLVGWLRRDAASEGVLAGIVAAGAATVAVILVSLAVRSALASDAAILPDVMVAQLIRDIADDAAAFAVFAQIAVMGLASWALLASAASRRAARVTGRVFLVITAFLIAGTVSLAAGSRDIADPGWLTLALWTAGVSVLMIRARSAQAA